MTPKHDGLWCLLFGVCLVIFGLPSPPLSAHGVQGKLSEGGLAAMAAYSDGTAMSYAKVRIKAPDTERTFQSGRTDRNGRFCFWPDMPGQWEIVVDDEMGHRLALTVPVDATPGNSAGLIENGNTARGLSTSAKVLMGLCVIFGLCGLVAWWKGKTPTSLQQADND